MFVTETLHYGSTDFLQGSLSLWDADEYMRSFDFPIDNARSGIHETNKLVC